MGNRDEEVKMEANIYTVTPSVYTMVLHGRPSNALCPVCLISGTHILTYSNPIAIRGLEQQRQIPEMALTAIALCK